jgi:UDP-glucose 4-epimerase
MKHTVFVTGGLGFIGSHIAKKLVHMGYPVRIYDNFSSGSLKHIEEIKQKVEIIRGDILDKKSLTRAMKGASIVSHHAAQLEITRAIKDPYFDLTSNTIGTINVLEACLANNVKKLINISSACVYGQTSGQPSRETDATNPNWAYGISKLAAEKYCSIYNSLYHLPIISLRYAIIYGPDEWYGRVMTIFIKRAIEGKPLIIFGDGKQTRDFTHVHLAVEANIQAIKYSNTSHEIINVSTGTSTSIASLAKKIAGITKSEIIFDTTVKEGEVSKLINRMRIPEELHHLVLSPAKLHRLLDVSQSLTFTQGLQQQMNWAKKHPEAWKTMSY